MPFCSGQNKSNFFGLFHFLKSGPCQRHGSFLIIKGSFQKHAEASRSFQKKHLEASSSIQKYPETFRSIQTHPEASRSIEKKHLESSRTGSHRFILLYKRHVNRHVIQSVYGSQSVSIIKTVYRSEFYQSVLSKNINTRSEIQQVFHYINTVHIQPRRCVPQSIIVSSQGKCNTVSLEKRDYLFLLFL